MLHLNKNIVCKYKCKYEMCKTKVPPQTHSETHSSMHLEEESCRKLPRLGLFLCGYESKCLVKTTLLCTTTKSSR